MDKIYDFTTVEKKWNLSWSERRIFHAEPDSRASYSIVIPPPNVTDILHLGHAFNNTVQDILIRYHRNMGMNAEWLPGTDHAGIATQVVVEKLLRKEGLSKESLGRDAFEAKVWEWANDRRNIILNQLRGIGASCDWDRTKFTLDKDMSLTVATVFKKLYDKGLIYKGTYIVNWCPRCHTALSDDEVDYRENSGKLYYIKYPLKDGSGFITVATTRPETMLGDSAVAVNPNDARTSHLIGKTVILPLMNREIPIIGDDYVDMEFGTGFVKVTPAHDPNDFQIGKRHSLNEIVIMDTKGIINSSGGKYSGMERSEARKAIIKDLEETGLVEKIEDYKNSVGECYRCKTVIEPYLSEQWFVDMKPLAEPALEASKSGELSFYPQRWQGVYNHWLENIKPWCISRQLWWGHRIPVYYCDSCGHEFASVEKPEKCAKCSSSQIRQDENVLDTWFSSWLWPFATFGWREDSADYRYFYPTKVIVSASEILFFWIARMVMAGIEFTGKLPFRDIMIHGTVRDSKGVKMSKSLGNGIDPLLIVSKYGADALRFTVVFLSGQGKDPNVSENSFELGRNFANKIWNAARFMLMKGEGFDASVMSEPEDIYDRWILHRYSLLEKSFASDIKSYRLSDGASRLYDFFWKDLCDWYLEIIKIKGKSMHIALSILYRFVRLLNPYMPYISEEIYSILGSSKMISETPHLSVDFSDEKAEAAVENIKSLVTAIRNISSETGVSEVDIVFDGESGFAPEEHIDEIRALSKAESLNICAERPKKGISGAFSCGIVAVDAKNISDLDEKVRIYEKDHAQLMAEIEKIERNLSNKAFLSKAPEEIVEGFKSKLEEFTLKRDRISSILKSLKEE